MEGYCAVACLGLSDGRDAGGITGAWLVWYDPAGNNGNGDAAWSHDPADAARFTEWEWADLYAAVPANRPLRPDGKPNRPITMFNLAVVPVRLGELPSIPPAPEADAPEPPMTDAELAARIDKIVAAAAARKAAGASQPAPPLPRPPSPEPEPEPGPDKPDLSEPGALTASLRAMGLI